MSLIDDVLAAADLLPESILIVSDAGAIAGANAAFLEQYGWTRARASGASLAELIASGPETWTAYLRQCASSRTLRSGTLDLRHPRRGIVRSRAEGGLLRSRTNGDDPLVLLRLAGGEEAASAEFRDEHELRGRLSVLAEASGTLFASLEMRDILPAVGALAERLVPADAYALWKIDEDTRSWNAVWHRNLSGRFVAAITGSNDDPNSLVEPLLVPDTTAVGMLGSRQPQYAAEGIRSLAIIPLRWKGQALGTVVAYYREPRTFTEADRTVATALSNLGSSALGTAELYEEQSRSRAAAEAAERRAAFLANAGAALAGALGYEETLKTVARLAVPQIADWCAVDVVTRTGQLTRLAVAHVDPAKVAFVQRLEERYPRDADSPAGAEQVVKSMTPVLLPEIQEEMLRAAAKDARHLEMILHLGLTSYICVPLVLRGRPLGAITLATAESGRRYTDEDLRFAQEVALRAALAMENARAYDEVTRANRLKDDFLATLSHELRTPLNAVLGYTRMLRTGALPVEGHPRALETIERNASALTQLVEDVLDVSRIEAGKIRLDVQPVMLPELVETAVSTVAPAALGRGVRMETILDPQTPAASGDPERLQQVLWNLLSNAVKFTPRGGRVQVRLERVNSHVEITVSDTGAGIPPEFLPYVFDRFRQADSRFSREHGGLGLGLAITRHLVEMHGGTIHAASGGVGKGSSFCVRLPLRIVHSERPEDHAHPRSWVPEEAGPLADLHGVRVLAVDDDPDALALLSEVLTAAGAEVTPARSAGEALERLSEARTDVIISDIGMPAMDGFALIARIRTLSDERLRATPAAALTAYARSEDRTRALKSGFQMHLSKPINPAELAAAVLALVRSGRRPSRPPS